MKRRDFLKILGTLVIAPSAVITAAKVKPKQSIMCIDPSKPHKWKNYYAKYSLTKADKEEFREKFRMALKNTKFKRPEIPYGISYWCKT